MHRPNPEERSRPTFVIQVMANPENFEFGQNTAETTCEA
jgi:hypothetical protein